MSQQDEATPEVAAAHQKAFRDAINCLESELKDVGEPTHTLVALTQVRNEFELWEDGQIDGPMPALPTVEALRSKFQYILVEKMAWKQSADYQGQVEKICFGHMGGGTSMSYKFFALFQKGLGAVRTCLKSNMHEKALCQAIALTKAMSDNDEWYGDTDTPETAANIVKELSKLWKTVLSSPLEDRDWAMLRAWLAGICTEWEGPASDHLGMKLSFALPALPASPSETPCKKESHDAAKDLLVDGDLSATKTKKRKATAGSESKDDTKKARTLPVSEDVERWLHQLDSELPKRQASAVQVVCEAGEQKRALVFSGAYPLKAVGFAIAEAFGKAVDAFDPHPNKGKAPPGLAFAVQFQGKQHMVKPTVKLVQAVQEPGDSMVVRMDGLEVGLTLDAIKCKGSAGYDFIKDRPLPRCVGGDRKFGPQLLKRLNKIYFGSRQPVRFLGCSKREAIQATVDDMAKPIALKRGELVVEGLPSFVVEGLESFAMPHQEPGSIPGNHLQPLTLQ